MILQDLHTFEDLEDYATWSGMFHSAANKPISDSLFMFVPTIRALYELAYEMEKESGILWLTSTHQEVGIVTQWDDAHGMGKFKIPGTQTDQFFSYNDFEDIFQDLSVGDAVIVRYKFDYDLKVISIQKTNGQ